MKPLNLNLKIISGKKTEVEKEFNEFKQNHRVYFSPTQVTAVNDGGMIILDYHIFVYYE